MHFGRFNRTVLELAYVTLVLMSILNGLTKSGFGVELLVKVVFRGKGINDDNEYKSINAHVGAFICVGLVSVALTERLNSAAHGSIISLGATTHTLTHSQKHKEGLFFICNYSEKRSFVAFSNRGMMDSLAWLILK